MRTTLVIDDELLAEALLLTGLAQRSAVMNEALKALIAREIVQHVGVPEQLPALPHWQPADVPELTRFAALTVYSPRKDLDIPPDNQSPDVLLRDAISGLTIWTSPPRQLVENGRSDHLALTEATGRTDECPFGRRCALGAT